MLSNLPDLLVNLAVVALFFALWGLTLQAIAERKRWQRNLMLGGLMGAGAVSSMLLAVQIEPGVIIDLRTSLVAVAGFFGGPVAVLAAGAITIGYRLGLGGTGLVPGIIGIVLAALAGATGYTLRGQRAPVFGEVVILGVVVSALATAGLFLLPAPLAQATAGSVGVPFTLLNFTSTVIAGTVILHGSRMAADRGLLDSALAQAPDFYYVKDRNSRFVSVNKRVAQYNGFTRPAEMIGKSDFDIVPAERARQLFQNEQRVMDSGVPIFGAVERLTEKDGAERYFASTKIPLRDADGQIVGLAGVTREVTEQRRLEAELTNNRNLLAFAMNEMSDGLAMFSGSGELIYCNERYGALFPRTTMLRKPGTNIRRILEGVVASGEQLNIGNPQAWIDKVAGSLQVEGDEQVSLFDGRWLLVRTRPTADGASMVAVSDVTNIKTAENQMKVLADTDGLTGLMNRRAFDAALVEATARTEREDTPISLVLMDVDRFKAFNDTYGHPAGDECLRLVSQCLKLAVRQGEMAARYGGEEFALVLPDTDAAGAFTAADRVRRALLDVKLPHRSSEHGVVTLSGGIATYPRGETQRSAPLLIKRADEALYDSKEAGRNRITNWRDRQPALKAGEVH